MKTIFYINLVAAFALALSIIFAEPKKEEIVVVEEIVEVEEEPVVVIEPPKVELPDDPWAELIVKYFPAEHVDDAVKVSQCENRSRTAETISLPNRDQWGSRDYGLFQLNDHWQGNRVGGDVQQFLDPEINVRVASEIFRDSGYSWALWTCRKVIK
jgi:hypothetical protein